MKRLLLLIILTVTLFAGDNYQIQVPNGKVYYFSYGKYSIDDCYVLYGANGVPLNIACVGRH